MDAETRQALEDSKEMVAEYKAMIDQLDEKEQKSIYTYHNFIGWPSMDAETRQALEDSKEMVAEYKAMIDQLDEKEQKSIYTYHNFIVKLINNDEAARMAVCLIGAELQVVAFTNE